MQRHQAFRRQHDNSKLSCLLFLGFSFKVPFLILFLSFPILNGIVVLELLYKEIYDSLVFFTF